jgi:protein-disulfide isomerase
MASHVDHLSQPVTARDHAAGSPDAPVTPHARHAAEAAEAAAAQGEPHFWAMHDALIEHQQALEDAQLVQYAADIGLDTGCFSQDLGQHTFLHHIQEDLESGAHSGVHGTPTLFINGVRYDGLPSTAELYRVLLSELGDGVDEASDGAS